MIIYTYDTRNRLSSRMDSNKTFINYAYDVFLNLIIEENHRNHISITDGITLKISQHFTYDDQHQLFSSQDKYHRIRYTLAAYDILLNRTVNYPYDAFVL